MAGVKRVATIMAQTSVVVKGIERKVKELGYEVTSLVGEFERTAILDQVLLETERTPIFITYLPMGIADNQYLMKGLMDICGIVEAAGKRMMLIGEANEHQSLMNKLPQISKCKWVNRPVDMNSLEDLLNEMSGNAPAAPAKPAEKKKRILIVDDDPSYAKMVREWIKDKYRVDIVTAGMQAITFLVKVPPEEKVDMILLDYEMPIVDGPQVLQMLRQEPATAGIPVMFLTGIGTREAVGRVMELKPDGYVLKSITREDLLKTLASKLHG